MAWEDVPAKLDAYDAMEYADNSQGTTASQKLLRTFTVPVSDDLANVPEERRDEFEAQLDYRMGACANLEKSRAWRPNPGVWP